MIDPEEHADSTECIWTWGRLIEKTAPLVMKTQMPAKIVIVEAKTNMVSLIRFQNSRWITNAHVMRLPQWLN